MIFPYNVMKKYLLTALAIISLRGIAQEVLVSHPSYPASHLTMNGEKLGFHLPNVNLEDVSSVAPLSSASEGMMVYNTNPDIRFGNGIGIYMFINNRWVRSGENADYFIIKDEPQEETILSNYQLTSVRNARQFFTYPNNQNSFTRLGNECFSDPTVSSTSYCVYQSTQNITWNEAFNAAKFVGGYIVTITNSKEQQFVERILEATNANTNVWLGHRKINHRNATNQENPLFTPYYFTLMDSKKSVEWGNRPKLFHNFISLEPDNNLGLDGCVLMLGNEIGNTDSGIALESRKWIDTNCANNQYSGNGSNASNTGIKTLIIEYNSLN